MPTIEGNAAYIPINDFSTKIQRCLDLLTKKAPGCTVHLNSYVTKVRAARASGANFADKSIDIAKATFDSTDTWVASVLVHEAAHFWQYKTGKYKASKADEQEANLLQLTALRLIGAPASEISYLQKQDGGHADLDGDVKYTEKDYQKRKY
jgi:predicted SprT family Zn-dependent metalloprotease